MVPEWRDIAVFLDESPVGEQIGRRAALLAQRHKAHLVGVYGVPRDRTRWDGYVRGPGIKAHLKNRHLADENKVLAAGRYFGTLSEDYAISSEFRIVWRDGLMDDAVLRALHCDLIVAAHPKPEGLPENWSAERLLLNTGTPVLVIADGWTGEEIGETVLIAWNRSREARRAVSDAMPFISTARHVTILVIDDERDTDHSGEQPGINLFEHLSRHGAKVEIAQVSAAGAPIAQVIASEAVPRGANLLVLGAYSRPRTSEVLFGGTTRSLLASVPVPLLISR